MSLNLERLGKNNPFDKSFFPDSLPKGAISPSDEGEFFLQLPHSDLHGWVYSDSDFYKNYTVFSEQMSRLRGIACLSFVAHIDHHINYNDQHFYRSSHTLSLIHI